MQYGRPVPYGGGAVPLMLTIPFTDTERKAPLFLMEGDTRQEKT